MISNVREAQYQYKLIWQAKKKQNELDTNKALGAYYRIIGTISVPYEIQSVTAWI